MHIIPFHWVDGIDILVVSALVYYLLKFIKGTRATQMVIGLFLVFLLIAVANIFNLSGMKWIAKGLKDVWIVAFVIVFQPEIRNALASLGKTRLFFYLYKGEEEKIAENIASACEVLKDKRIGALIAIERRAGLRSYMETGVKIDAEVDSHLLVSIFSPYSPLHDGAVIIKGERIIAAACILPLSDNPSLPPEMGTRHRAALGITEETDSICVIVSEETGRVSFAVGGDIKEDLSISTLKSEMLFHLKREVF